MGNVYDMKKKIKEEEVEKLTLIAAGTRVLIVLTSEKA